MQTGSSGVHFDDRTDGLADAVRPEAVDIADGGRFDVVIGPVHKRIGDVPVKMLAYNGSVPGPTLRVRQGAKVQVDVTNETDLDQTVHWHGLRLENRFDGVPEETQKPIPPGVRFTYELTFPDAGLYWYHPHLREDYGQEMGLYGCIVVQPAEADYWPAADESLVLTVDDVLLEDGRLAPFSRGGPTHTMMGRFGNVMLVGGETAPAFPARTGKLLRLFLTNTANVRVFNLAFDGATMKLIGGDSGRVEREQLIDELLLAPSERAIVDVLFPHAGPVRLLNRTPQASQPLATFEVGAGDGPSPAAEAFGTLRVDPSLTALRASLEPHRGRQPDYTLLLVGAMDMGGEDMDMAMDDEAMHGGHMDMGGMEMDTHGDGVEWEDGMPEMNAMSTNADMAWQLVDAGTRAVNDDIAWTLRVGQQVKIRLDNTGGDHLMHHPFHIHGAGRFVVLERGGVEEPNLMWKDTVLIRGGEVVDILFEVTNPGRWMAHCHIAEHAENGMMFNFDVLAGPEAAR